ncbi:MAG: methylmalonyl-CoA epimerase [Acidobacteria bacterium]|nr:methylmalonyl-CoA epimerase [Acidobacteriota bacterium]
MRKPRFDHIGIAVRSIEDAALFRDLGLTVAHVEIVETQNVKTAFIPVGDANLELLEATSGDSPIAKFIEKRGEGIHHICLRVDQIDEHLETLKAKGYRLVNESAVPGAHGCRVAFLHPSAGNGVLIELSEKADELPNVPEDDVEAIL